MFNNEITLCLQTWGDWTVKLGRRNKKETCEKIRKRLAIAPLKQACALVEEIAEEFKRMMKINGVAKYEHIVYFHFPHLFLPSLLLH